MLQGIISVLKVNPRGRYCGGFPCNAKIDNTNSLIRSELKEVHLSGRVLMSDFYYRPLPLIAGQ